MHPLARILEGATGGRFPAADGGVEVTPPWRPGVEAVVALTGHAYVATGRDPASVLSRRPDGFGGATAPAFLLWLAGEGGIVGSHDALLAGRGSGRGGLPPRPDLDDHPRAQMARMIRDDVAVYGDDRGLVTLSRGIGGLWETSVEVDPGHRDAGAGRALLAGALGNAPAGEVVLASVAPGNAQSLRAFLAAGFRPLGAVVIVVPAR